MNKNPVFYKMLVLVIVFLFIVMSVVSSTGNIVNDNTDNIMIQNTVNNSKELLLRGKIAYAFIPYPGTSGHPEGSCYFALDEPSHIVHVSNYTGDSFLSGGTLTTDGRWLCCEFGTGVLWEIDIFTGESWAIGGGGEGYSNALAFDPVTNRIFGVSSHSQNNDRLWQVDPDTGEQTEIGEIDLQRVIGIAFDENGILYGWDIEQDSLHIIDPDTLEVETVGPLGFDIGFAQDGAFDWDTNTLYLSAYTDRGFLATCNIETGELTYIGDFEGGAELTAFVIIPNNWSSRPYADFTWTPSLPDPDETILFDASKSHDPDGYITFYEWDWDNDSVFDENHTNPIANHSWSDYGFYPVTLKVTDNNSLTGIKTKTVRIGNRAPNTPVIEGKRKFKEGEGGEYPYIIHSLDPDGDNVLYIVNFSDGEFETDYYASGENMTIKVPIPTEEGTYVLFKIKARDIFGNESDWEILEIEVPRNRILYNLLYQWLLERFPIMEVFLRIINQ